VDGVPPGGHVVNGLSGCFWSCCQWLWGCFFLNLVCPSVSTKRGFPISFLFFLEKIVNV
jgi:hypothetical protein